MRRLYFGLNVFAWSMLCAPAVNGLALLWIAIEITTVVSALLVAIDNTDEAVEASWKYVLLASTGLGIASLALAALYLLDQRDIKRMLAYSSVKHMGILAIAVSFGVPLALFGALLASRSQPVCGHEFCR